MSAPILGQVQVEVIAELSSLGAIKCVAFSHSGTLLAAGFSVGTCAIWDFQTKKITNVLWDKNHIAPTTSICWSKNDHCLLVSDIERSLILWDAVSGTIMARTMLRHKPMQVQLHPGSTTPSVCLACPLSSPPLIVDFKTGSTIVLPIDVKNKPGGFIPVTPTAACFNKHGDLVYVGNHKGEILVIDHESINIQAIIPAPRGAMIKNIAFSRNGMYLHTNSSDGIIRIYKNLLPINDTLQTLNDATRGQAAKPKKLKAIGSRCLDLLQEISNSITELHWKTSCISHDGKFVAGASACRPYKICVWDNTGRFVKSIDGPNEMLIDITWHPVHPVVVSVSRTGAVFTWGNNHAEAFSPKFQGLEEMESEERGDGFDSTPKTEITASQSLSHLIASGSLEEVGRKTYMRRKKMVSKPEADTVMMPPPSK